MSLRAAFLDNWNESGAWLHELPHSASRANEGNSLIQVVSSSSTIEWTKIASLIRTMVSVSKHKLYLTTAYFTPDKLLVKLLCEAVERGVDVKILVPGKFTDSRLSVLAGQVHYQTLLEAGVGIFKFETTVLHAKLAIIDGCISCVGSANLNHRSLGKDEECSIVILDTAVYDEFLEQFEDDLSQASEVTLKAWNSRSRLKRLIEKLSYSLREQL